MKKLKNLGTSLTKNEMKKINGGQALTCLPSSCVHYCAEINQPGTCIDGACHCG